MTASVLGTQNYDIALAATGAEALAAARVHPPDLILLDLHMPGMDGLQTCRAVRADAKLAEVPVVLCTGLSDREARLRGFEAGADDFISKPYDPDELRLRVRSVTRLNRFRRLHDQRRRTERVISIAREGYVLVRQDGILLQANPAAWRLLGGIPDRGGSELNFVELVRKRYRSTSPDVALDDLWAVSDKPCLLVGRGAVQHQTRWLQLEVLDPHGTSERWLRLQDVSHEHALQRDLWTFHGAVSHKLRTPLNGLLGSLQLLALELESADPNLQELVEMAQTSAARLDSSISGILSYLATGQGGENVPHVPWALTQLPELVRAAADRGGVRRVTTFLGEGATPASIALPTATLALCFEALFDNACKFHPRHDPEVTVTAMADRQWVCLVVQDDGIHLAPNALSQAWDPYYQAETTYSGEVPGMGLGLAMVSAIVLDAGGERMLRNRADRPGVEVELRLPRVTTTPTALPPGPGAFCATNSKP